LCRIEKSPPEIILSIRLDSEALIVPATVLVQTGERGADSGLQDTLSGTYSQLLLKTEAALKERGK
jgi:hypothetical protein